MNMSIDSYDNGASYLVLEIPAESVEAFQASTDLWATLVEICGDADVDYSAYTPTSLTNQSGNHEIVVTLH